MKGMGINGIAEVLKSNGERSQKSADILVKRTAQCLKALPLFVTDGLKFYKIALMKQYGKLQSFARTGK